MDDNIQSDLQHPQAKRLPYVRQRDEERLTCGSATTSGNSNSTDDQQQQQLPTHQRFRVVVSYDGTDFAGWQTQEEGGDGDNSNNNKSTQQQKKETIQSRIEQRLSQIFCSGARYGVTIAGSGRTDAGVHAAGQQFHFDAPRIIRLPEKKKKAAVVEKEEEEEVVADTTPATAAAAATTTTTKQKKPQTIMKETPVDAVMVLQFLRNGLPPSIQVLGAAPVPPSFHARESCIKKRYQYTICEGVASPFLTRYCYSLGHGKRLNLDDMIQAAQRLKGQHDFSAFGVIEEGDRRSPVKNLTMLEVKRYRQEGDHDHDHDDGDATPTMIRITAECDRFLWHMMRMISGTLLDCGAGVLSPDDVEGLLLGKERGAKHQHAAVRVRTAPAHGLKLMRVYYDDAAV